MKIQLCYASTRNLQSEDLLQDLNDILTIARDFNSRHDICGVLYYADGSFFNACKVKKRSSKHYLLTSVKMNAIVKLFHLKLWRLRKLSLKIGR